MGNGPTILQLETDSAWVVIVAVSAATLVAALALRRLIGRPGGVASGILLSLPLVVPVVAALVYEHAVLPEIGVLKPAQEALIDRTEGLRHLLLLSDGKGRILTPYALAGSAGPWILLIGVAVSSFMLVRRFAGTVLVHRLIRRCSPLGERHGEVRDIVARLARAARLSEPPEVLLLPEGASGAFVVGGRRGRILMSGNLLVELDAQELEGVLAHEVAHLEAKDLPVVFTAGLLRDMVAWNPVSHVALRRLVLDRELEADRRAAAMTGKPLAVASGLLKLCGLIGRPKRFAYRAALAFLRPGGPITRRISSLLALADGRDPGRAASSLPYVMAACLVAVVGLQVGARIARDDSSAYAIVVGAPSTDGMGVWKPPRVVHEEAGNHKARRDRSRRAEAARDLGFPLRHRLLLRGLALKQQDFPAWLDLMTRYGARNGMSPATMRWLAIRDNRWEAVSLFSHGQSLPIGIYRLEGGRL